MDIQHSTCYSCYFLLIFFVVGFFFMCFFLFLFENSHIDITTGKIKIHQLHLVAKMFVCFFFIWQFFFFFWFVFMVSFQCPLYWFSVKFSCLFSFFSLNVSSLVNKTENIGLFVWKEFPEMRMKPKANGWAWLLMLQNGNVWIVFLLFRAERRSGITSNIVSDIMA